MVESNAVEMGECKGCGKPWSLSKIEHELFQRLVRDKNFKMPSHCQDCRDKKRTAEKSVNGAEIYNKLMNTLHEMATEAEKGHYSFEDTKLTSDLRDVIREVRRLARRLGATE